MTKLSIWLNATRPKTLPAGLAPVMIGGALAYHDNSFNLQLFLLMSVLSVLIQILTNFINEIYDYKKGADNQDRLGPQRAVASGLIFVKQMSVVSIILATIIFASGMILVYHSGWIILVIGILSLLFAYSYTGGPYPLAYHGLAEPFVFVFFGVIAVNASYFVLTGRITEISIISSIMPGLLSTNLLLVNNLRDVDTDEPIGKYTLAVKIGKENSRHLYLILNFIVFFIPIILAIKLFTLWMLLPMLAVPLLAIMSIRIYFVEGKALNRVLAMNGLTILLNGILTSIAFIILKIYG